MSFIIALTQYKITILFYSLVFILVYLNRKKFDVHGSFIYLYRTQIGVKFMEKVANKATKAELVPPEAIYNPCHSRR